MKCKVVHSYFTGGLLDIEKVISLAVENIQTLIFTKGNVPPLPHLPVRFSCMRKFSMLP